MLIASLCKQDGHGKEKVLVHPSLQWMEYLTDTFTVIIPGQNWNQKLHKSVQRRELFLVLCHMLALPAIGKSSELWVLLTKQGDQLTRELSAVGLRLQGWIPLSPCPVLECLILLCWITCLEHLELCGTFLKDIIILSHGCPILTPLLSYSALLLRPLRSQAFIACGWVQKLLQHLQSKDRQAGEAKSWASLPEVTRWLSR